MNSIRTFIELASRNRSFKRVLPAEFGGVALYVSPDSQLKYLKPGLSGFDRGLLDNVRRHVGSGAEVWDIGANVGVFTFAAVGKGARVLSVEADPWLADLLRSSAALNRERTNQIRILGAAISSSCGIAELQIASRGRASNALVEAGGSDTMGGVRARVTVPTLTLDTLLTGCKPPNLVKVDVEGAESLVLKGGMKLLSEVRPTWIIEVNQSNARSVAEVFHSRGYILFDADNPNDGAPLKEAAFNTLAVPS